MTIFGPLVCSTEAELATVEVAKLTEVDAGATMAVRIGAGVLVPVGTPVNKVQAIATSPVVTITESILNRLFFILPLTIQKKDILPTLYILSLLPYDKTSNCRSSGLSLILQLVLERLQILLPHFLWEFPAEALWQGLKYSLPRAPSQRITGSPQL